MPRIRLAVFLLSLLIASSGSADSSPPHSQKPTPPRARDCWRSHFDDTEESEGDERDDVTSALLYSVEGEDIVEVKKLLRKGPDPNKDNGYTFPLIAAAAKNNPEIVSALLTAGADANAKDCVGMTALMMAIMHNTPVLEMPRHTAVVMALLDHGASVTVRCDRGWTPLIYAAWFGNTTALRLMLDKATELDTRDVQGRTALMWAAAQGHEDIVRALLDRGADARLEDSEGKTALWLADENNHTSIVRLLKKREPAL